MFVAPFQNAHSQREDLSTAQGLLSAYEDSGDRDSSVQITVSNLLLTTTCRQPFHRAELALNEVGFCLMALLDLLLASAECTKHLRTEFTIALALLLLP